MSVVLAVLGALVYGLADFAGGMASRRAPVLAVLLAAQALSILLVGTIVALTGGRFDPPSLVWGASAGVVGVLALLLFYRSLALGAMSVVAPLTAVTAAVVPVAAGLALGERPSPLALLGVLLALVAILLVSAEGGRLPRPQQLRGPVFTGALAAGAGFGLLFVLLSRAAPDSGFQPTLAARVASVSLLVTVTLLARRSPVPRGVPWPLLLVAGFGDITANLLFLTASRAGLLSITGVLIALYPAGTVLLALIVLKERLVALQVAGLALATAGVVLIAVA